MNQEEYEENDMLRVEQRVKKDFSFVESAIREKLPIYDKVMSNCGEVIAEYETCLSKNQTLLNLSTCRVQADLKQKCIEKNSCPLQFQAYQECINIDRRQCMGKKRDLMICSNEFVREVEKVTGEVWQRVKTRQPGFEEGTRDLPRR